MSRGFSPIVAIIILAVVLVVGGIMFLNRPDLKNQTGHEQSSRQNGQGLFSEGKKLEGLFGRCEGSGTTKLATFPLDPKDIELIIPMGKVQDSHVTPTDHQYIIPKGTKSGSIVTDEPERYQIKAPFNGFITNIKLFKKPI